MPDSPFKLHTMLAELEASVPDLNLADALDVFDALEQANRDLADLRHTLAGQIAALMPGKTVTLHGHTYEKSGRWRRTGWDIEQLLPTVLDTRRFDKTTGELIEETDLQKVLHVWSLGGPRTTALRERGFAVEIDENGNRTDPLDEWCQATWAGWAIKRLS